MRPAANLSRRYLSTTALRMAPKPVYVPATAPEIEHYVTQGWTQDEGYLRKKFTFKGFKSAWTFMQSVAEDAMRLQRQYRCFDFCLTGL